MLFKPVHGAYLVAKGFNSRVMATWLAEESQNAFAATATPSEELTLMAHAMLLGSVLEIGFLG